MIRRRHLYRRWRAGSRITASRAIVGSSARLRAFARGCPVAWMIVQGLTRRDRGRAVEIGEPEGSHVGEAVRGGLRNALRHLLPALQYRLPTPLAFQRLARAASRPIIHSDAPPGRLALRGGAVRGTPLLDAVAGRCSSSRIGDNKVPPGSTGTDGHSTGEGRSAGAACGEAERARSACALLALPATLQDHCAVVFTSGQVAVAPSRHTVGSEGAPPLGLVRGCRVFGGRTGWCRGWRARWQSRRGDRIRGRLALRLTPDTRQHRSYDDQPFAHGGSVREACIDRWRWRSTPCRFRAALISSTPRRRLVRHRLAFRGRRRLR